MLDVRSPLLADLLCRLMADPDGTVTATSVDDLDGEPRIRLDVAGTLTVTERELLNLQLAAPTMRVVAVEQRPARAPQPRLG